ncbi:MAG: glycosyltransferase family 2 protein [Nitrososphaerota archaeon]|nr:glycosyltransferase family 2 protein [Nitrososphaerota archaeon]
MSQTPEISVIVPTYNGHNKLMNCIDSLKRSSFLDLEIIVVDNGSTDDSVALLRAKYPDVRLIRNYENLGISRGRNIGALHSLGKYLLFVDHDVMIDREMIGHLVRPFRDNCRLGMTGPIIYYLSAPDVVWAAGTSINMKSGRVFFNASLYKEPFFEVEVIPATFMIPRHLFFKVGGFDSSFFATYEDTDICFRLRKSGYHLKIVANAKAWHDTPFGRDQKMLYLLDRSYFISKNRIVFMKKHSKRIDLLIFVVLYVPIYAIYYGVLSMKYHKLTAYLAYLKGIFDGLTWYNLNDAGVKVPNPMQDY